jgi:hypothetical protein
VLTLGGIHAAPLSTPEADAILLFPAFLRVVACWAAPAYLAAWRNTQQVGDQLGRFMGAFSFALAAPIARKRSLKTRTLASS